MIETWRHALTALEAGEPATLLMVVEHTGSVPGKAGATAVVTPRGLAGTIGGGAGEHQLSVQAAALDRRAALVRYDHTSHDNDSLCSGSHLVAMLRLATEDQPALSAIVATLGQGGAGTLELSPAGLHFSAGRCAARSFSGDDTEWRFCDTIGHRDTLYIIGGGHVSLALSRVMATLPFRIVVLDDREQVPTMQANSFADEIRVIDYARVEQHLSEGEHAWVAIMTYGHRADAEVLQRLAGRPFRYLGMMGSSAKVARIMALLEERGVPRQELERVVAPIGLAIGSHTPEEIAISIAAQLVALSKQP